MTGLKKNCSIWNANCFALQEEENETFSNPPSTNLLVLFHPNVATIDPHPLSLGLENIIVL